MIASNKHRRFELLQRVERRELSLRGRRAIRRLHGLAAKERALLGSPYDCGGTTPGRPPNDEIEGHREIHHHPFDITERAHRPCTQVVTDGVQWSLPPEVWLRVFAFCLAPDLGRAAGVCALWDRCVDSPHLWANLLVYHHRREPLVPPILGPPRDAVVLSFFSTAVRVNEGLLFVPRSFTGVAEGPTAPGGTIPAEELVDLVACAFRLPPRHLTLPLPRRSGGLPVTVRADPRRLELAMRRRGVQLCAICNTYYDIQRSADRHHAHFFPNAA